MAETEFQRKVYALCRQIPQGKVTTYKALAQALGTKAYRAIGQALKKNPSAPEVPCHRIIATDGSLGGYLGSCGGKSQDEKRRLLQKEGIEIPAGKINLRKHFWSGPYGRN